MSLIICNWICKRCGHEHERDTFPPSQGCKCGSKEWTPGKFYGITKGFQPGKSGEPGTITIYRKKEDG